MDVPGEDRWSVMGTVHSLGHFSLNTSTHSPYAEHISLALDIPIYYIVKLRYLLVVYIISKIIE